MLAYVAEFLGTFVFLSVILSQGQALPIAMALAVAIYLGGAISGGHFNPAVSVMMFLRNNIDLATLVGYVVAQVLGGVAAQQFNLLQQ